MGAGQSQLGGALLPQARGGGRGARARRGFNDRALHRYRWRGRETRLVPPLLLRLCLLRLLRRLLLSAAPSSPPPPPSPSPSTSPPHHRDRLLPSAREGSPAPARPGVC